MKIKSFLLLFVLLLCIGVISLKAYSKNEYLTFNLLDYTNTENPIKVVHNPKEGKLKSVIDKKEAPLITQLKVTGYISDKDMEFIGKMINLSVLDLSETNGILYEFPLLPKLIELYLPKAFLLNYNTTEAIGKCQSIEVLSICVSEYKSPRNGSIMHYGNFPFLPKLRKVIVANSLTGKMGNTVWQQAIDTLVYQIRPVGNEVIGFTPEIIVDEGGRNVLSNYIPSKRKDFNDIQGFVCKDYDNENICNLSEIVLPDVVFIGNYHFRRCPLETLILSPYIRVIGEYAFEECQSLKNIKFKPSSNPLQIENSAFSGNNSLEEIFFENPTYIANSAFYGCKNLKKLYFNNTVFNIEARAFADCSLDSVVFMGEVKEIEAGSFKSIDYVIFKTIPEKLSPNFVASTSNGYYNKKEYHYKVVVVPEGSANKFVSFGISENKIVEAGKKLSFNITVKEPGTILSYLPLEKLKSIDSLTITGFLYETDMAVIKKCKALKYLDLSHAFITSSPQAKKEAETETKFWLTFLQVAGDAVDKKYEKGEVSDADYLLTKSLAELAKSADKFEKADEDCFVPGNAFANMTLLETVKLPLRAKSIGSNVFYGCINLENVELPPYLISIFDKAFLGCSRLKNLDFPSTLSSLGEGVFKQCKALKRIDLSKSTFKGKFGKGTYDPLLRECDNLKELRLPNGITALNYPHEFKNCIIYFPITLSEMNGRFNNCELHFSSPNPPRKEYSISGNVIYIPKNCTTAYYTRLGEENTYIEE